MTTDSKTRGFVSSGWKRGLAVLGLVVAGGLMQGCIIESSSSPPANCDSALTIQWMVTEGGVSVACPAGSIVTVMVDNSSMIVDFPCTAHAGTTPATLTGNVTHNVSFYLMSDNTSAAQTLSKLENVPVPVGCGVTQQLSSPVEFSLTP